MIRICVSKIAELLEYDGQIIDADIEKVSTDSRVVDGVTLFVALRGEKFDGHNFIRDVLEKNVPAVVAEFVPDGVDKNKVILVEDTVKALGKIANYNRKQFNGKVIALTGSSGKTTVKEEIKTMLNTFATTYATSGNFNNHIGVPRSLLDLDMTAEYAVIEMGMSNRGEIEYLTTLAEPDIAIVTNVYPMHIEFLGSLENIARAKAEIFSGLKKDGIAIYNKDAEYADILRSEAEKYASLVLEYGRDNHPVDIVSDDMAEHLRYNAWCALKVAEVLGIDVKKAAEAIKDFSAPDGRGRMHQLSIEGRDIVLVDDSYSGQPEAMKLAIRALSKMNVKGRRIALLGKMAELGDYSKQAHIEVGKELAEANIDVVIGVCEETKDMLAQLPNNIEQYYFSAIDGVSKFLIDDLLKDGDAVLVKGAHYSSQVFKVADDLKSFQKM